MLKRHLATRYNMTPEQYRQRWNLPADYPMVAPAYAEKRRELAKKIGLGRKPAAPAKRSRTKAAAA
jgi:predicted transcriptional regulator